MNSNKSGIDVKQFSDFGEWITRKGNEIELDILECEDFSELQCLRAQLRLITEIMGQYTQTLIQSMSNCVE